MYQSHYCDSKVLVLLSHKSGALIESSRRRHVSEKRDGMWCRGVKHGDNEVARWCSESSSIFLFSEEGLIKLEDTVPGLSLLLHFSVIQQQEQPVVPVQEQLLRRLFLQPEMEYAHVHFTGRPLLNDTGPSSCSSMQDVMATDAATKGQDTDVPNYTIASLLGILGVRITSILVVLFGGLRSNSLILTSDFRSIKFMGIQLVVSKLAAKSGIVRTQNKIVKILSVLIEILIRVACDVYVGASAAKRIGILDAEETLPDIHANVMIVSSLTLLALEYIHDKLNPRNPTAKNITRCGTFI